MEGIEGLIKEDPAAAQQKLSQLLFDTNSTDAEAIRQKELAVGHLGDVYVKLQNAQALKDMLAQLRPFFAVIPKAKTAKIVRSIVDQIAKVPNSTELQVINCAMHPESRALGALQQRGVLVPKNLRLIHDNLPGAAALAALVLIRRMPASEPHARRCARCPQLPTTTSIPSECTPPSPPLMPLAM